MVYHTVYEVKSIRIDFVYYFYLLVVLVFGCEYEKSTKKLSKAIGLIAMAILEEVRKELVNEIRLVFYIF